MDLSPPAKRRRKRRRFAGTAPGHPNCSTSPAMGAEISTADALPRDEPPSESNLPIVPRIRRLPRVDVDAILWPIERAASSPRGRTAGRWLVTGTFLLALAAFAAFNSRAEPDGESLSTAMIPHPRTLAFHGHRGLAEGGRLQVVTAAVARAQDPPSAAHPPAGSLSRR